MANGISQFFLNLSNEKQKLFFLHISNDLIMFLNCFYKNDFSYYIIMIESRKKCIKVCVCV